MTLLEAATALATKLHDTSGEFITVCKQLLQDSRYLLLNELNEWSFLEAEGTFTTVADTAEYSFVTDFGEADLRRLSMLKDSDGRLLELRTIEDLDAQRPTTGTPRMVAFWNDQVRLWPTPESVETYTWKGYTRVADLADGEEPEWERTYDIVWRLGGEAGGLEYLDDPRASQKWAIFFSTMARMFGDDSIEDEDVTLSNFGSAARRGIFRDDQGVVWP